MARTRRYFIRRNIFFKNASLIEGAKRSHVVGEIFRRLELQRLGAGITPEAA